MLPVSNGLMTGRGCPVGDAAAGRSPVLIPSPELLGEHQASNSSTYPLQIQASSTPMVTQVLHLMFDVVLHVHTAQVVLVGSVYLY